MSETILHGQMSIVNEAGEVTILHQETSASDVLVDREKNTLGGNGSTAIPTGITNLQELTNKLGKLAFRSSVDSDDMGNDLSFRLDDLESSALLVGGDVEDDDIVLPESEINDDITGASTTWSSKKISGIVTEINNNNPVFYVNLTQREGGGFIVHTPVTDIEAAYQKGKSIWVSSSDIFIPLRKRVSSNTWIFSGYTGNNIAYDVTVTSEGATLTYAEVATVTKLTTTVNELSDSIDGRLKILEGSGDGSVAKALADAKAYTDDVKKGILGEGISETYDTLKEIQTWIEGDGVNAKELTDALAVESKTRSDADIEINNKIDIINGNATTEGSIAYAIANDATKVSSSNLNGYIKINNTDTTVYTHPTTEGNIHVPAGGEEGKILVFSGDKGTAMWGSDTVMQKQVDDINTVLSYLGISYNPDTKTVTFN